MQIVAFISNLVGMDGFVIITFGIPLLTLWFLWRAVRALEASARAQTETASTLRELLETKSKEEKQS